MTNFSINSKKPVLAHFWSIFPILGANFFSPENQILPCTTSYGFLAQGQNLEKTNDTIPRKCLDRRMEGRMEGQADSILKDPSAVGQIC